MKKIFYLCCCLILLGALPAPAKEKERGGDRDERRSEDSRYVEEHDRGEHRGEYKSDKSGRHKEAKRHKTPPPGWRKKINRGERVDDSIYIYLEPPAPEVIAVLPPPPPGVSFRQIEDQIVKIDDLNRQVIEILQLDKLPLPKLPKLPMPPLPPLPR